VAIADPEKSSDHAGRRRLSGASQANRLVSILRMLLKFGVDRGWRKDNPTTEIPPIKVKSDGFPPWSEDEISAFESYWPVGTRERLAFDLLLCTAQRSGDVRTMTWKDIRGDAIAVRQEKTSTALVIPIHPRLRASLDVAPREHQVIVATKN